MRSSARWARVRVRDRYRPAERATSSSARSAARIRNMRFRYWSRGLTVSGSVASAKLARASAASRTRSSTSPS